MAVTRMIIDDPESYFGPLFDLVRDESITDIDFNGRMLFLTTSSNLRHACSDVSLSQDFVEEFTRRVSNTVSKQFNKNYPILEAETDTLRITIVHESVAISGRIISIRKSMPFVRMTEESMIREHYASAEVIKLLKSCVDARMNMVFCGEPGVGKTECVKFFSGYIPEDERIISIEDTPELHLSSLRPTGDSVELRIGDCMDYTMAIKTCLRLNPAWLMLSEARSTEIIYLIEGFSTGVRGMTTLHADDVLSVPDRMLNMAGSSRSEGRLLNDIYSFVDVAVLIKRRSFIEDGREVIRRYIDQVGFFYRSKEVNAAHLAVSGGRMTETPLPREIAERLGANDPIPDPGYEERAREVQKIMENAGLALGMTIGKGGTYLGKTKAIG